MPKTKPPLRRPFTSHRMHAYLCVLLVVLPLLCRSFYHSPIPFNPSLTTTSPSSTSRLRIPPPVSLASSPYSWDGYLSPGTYVYVNDLGMPGVILRNDGGGIYTLQVKPSGYMGQPLLVRRHVRDLTIPNRGQVERDPFVRKPNTPEAVSQRSQPSIPQQQPQQSQQPYTLFQDPRTGKIYAVQNSPRLPEETKGGRRLAYAPPRDQMKDYGMRDPPTASRSPFPPMGAKRYPGGDFVRDSFTRALENEGQQGPRAFDLWKDLARAQLMEGDTRNAQESFRKAYQADQRRFDDDMMSGLAEAQHREGRVNEAMQTYKKAMDINGQNSRLMLKYAISLHDQGNAPASIPYYNQAIELDPANLAAYNNLGVALQELGQYEAALACFRKALEIDGLHAPALQNLAALTLRQGRVKLAVECIRRALLLDPNDETARALLVQVMQAMSNRRTYQYPMLPGGVMDTDVGDNEQQRTNEEDVEDDEEREEDVTGHWRTDDEEGSVGEAQKYLTWEEILQNAWKAREEMMRKKQEEEEERIRAEEEKRAKEREAARERAREVEERIQELFYGRPPNAPPTSSSARREIPIRAEEDEYAKGYGTKATPSPIQDETPIASKVRPQQQFERPKAAGVRPSMRYGYPPTTQDVADEVEDQWNSQMGSPYYQGYRPSPIQETPATRRPQQEREEVRPMEDVVARSSPWGRTVPQQPLEVEEDEEAEVVDIPQQSYGKGPAFKQAEEEEGKDTDGLMKDRLKASYDAWSQLQNAAWADQARKEEALAELKRSLQRQQESKLRQEEELRKARLEQERAEAEAQRRLQEVELQQRKAAEALRMTKMVEEQTRLESERLKAKVEQDRAEAVRRAWEEQLQAAVERDAQRKREMEAERMEAVKKAVESERMMLENERQRAILEEQVIKEREQAERAAREKEVLDRLQEWERYKVRERERQIQEWEERERAMEEKRRRVQSGLGLDFDMDTFDEAEPVTQTTGISMEDISESEEEHSQLATVASVPLMITRDMRRTLIEDLNYSRRDVNKLKPEEAMEIIKRGIRNPGKSFSRPGTTSGDDDVVDLSVLDNMPSIVTDTL